MVEFTAAVENYDRFMGRYATGLAPKFADAAGVRAGMRVLDVGCGPGALAVELAGRVGEDNVAAIDPAPQFAAACQARIPGADVREGVAESLPWDDGTFDAAMCSLVVAWMSDADQGIGEMARVTKPGGTVAAAMWTTRPTEPEQKKKKKSEFLILPLLYQDVLLGAIALGGEGQSAGEKMS